VNKPPSGPRIQVIAPFSAGSLWPAIIPLMCLIFISYPLSTWPLTNPAAASSRPRRRLFRDPSVYANRRSRSNVLRGCGYLTGPSACRLRLFPGVAQAERCR
jgi:hypothetical protein